MEKSCYSKFLQSWRQCNDIHWALLLSPFCNTCTSLMPCVSVNKISVVSVNKISQSVKVIQKKMLAWIFFEGHEGIFFLTNISRTVISKHFAINERGTSYSTDAKSLLWAVSAYLPNYRKSNYRVGTSCNKSEVDSLYRSRAVPPEIIPLPVDKSSCTDTLWTPVMDSLPPREKARDVLLFLDGGRLPLTLTRTALQALHYRTFVLFSMDIRTAGWHTFSLATG